jgi:membrane-associated phospholipid phosphatase
MFGSEALWSYLTNLGDSALMGPIALCVGVWLCLSRAPKGAGAWLGFCGAAAIIVVCTKVAYIGWGIGIREIDFTGISGHAMISAATLAITGYFVGAGFGGMAAGIGGAFGFLVGVLVGASRVILGVHSLSEVVLGCALGGLVAVASAILIETPPRDARRSVVLASTVVALVIVLHGGRMPSEPLITKVSLYLSGRSAPFMPHGRWL